MASTHTQVQLFFKCHKLIDADTFSKSDPYIVVYDLTMNGPKNAVGRTETIRDNLNPVFKTPVSVNYFFEMRQDIKLDVWDEDKGKADDFLGKATFTMGHLMSSPQSSLTLKLDTKGTVTVTASLIGTTKGTAALQLRGRELKKMNVFGKTDAFIVISRLLPTGQKRQVHKTEVQKKTLNPQWKTTPPLDLVDLCGGETAAPCIALDCYNADSGSGEPMGGCVLSAEKLITGAVIEMELVLKKKDKTKSYGYLSIDRCDYVKGYDFLEYLQAGMEINIAFSIDFTGSNGPPNDPRSLHFYNPQRPNNYIRAMLAVSDVVQEYDSDRMFPAYGFGAIAPFTNGTSHFFPLSGNPANAYLSGMQAVVDTYASLLPVLRFSGPTNFAPTIRTITDGARQARGVYTILLILTDGAITDMQDTIDAIVEADDAPLSIVIIGIGRADFSSMERLDGDTFPLQHRRGNTTRRDLVQFVPFNEFENKPPSALSAAVLEEIPRQVEVWGRIAQLSPAAFHKG
ncbi:copine i-like protein [Leptomonas pyrrhocoris]|uniref:Copine i-like protein n=1 Tax=Leptomonas pyrrhocoris TaxID=157538 RepID=A0A0M9G958_LEPPY|nr:copine i-like protein [Leptomonas pyrrhocoris]KPA85390.1 copine i-like protein [Leptomonas pyrrhocoris]|eukprot:XP_015663829.1 copine i-like protein [Leptomonas pyrrhocoris]